MEAVWYTASHVINVAEDGKAGQRDKEVWGEGLVWAVLKCGQRKSH